MKSKQPKIISLLVLFAGFLLFFTGFFFDPFKVTIGEKRLDNQAESLVIGRLVKSRSDGMFSAGGLCGRCKNDSAATHIIDYQYTAFHNGHACEKYIPYLSQIGFHGVIYSLIEKASPFSPSADLTLLHVFKSGMLAGVMSLIVYWFFLEFGLLSSLLVMAGIALTPWFTYLGRDLWFCIWTNYLPFLLGLYLLKNRSEKSRPSGWLILLAVNLAILANFVINGYEWVSATLVMAAMPFFYYGIKDRWPLKNLVRHIAWLVAGSVASLLLTFTVLVYQISLVKGSFSDGIRWIIFSFQKRAHGSAEGLPEVYEKQVSQPLYEVFLKYFSAPAFKFPGFITRHTPWYLDGVLFIELILLFFLASWLIFFRPGRLSLAPARHNVLKALSITTWVSILAPFSWYIIFKGHAWSHDHIDFITWFMPFCLFGLALTGATLQVIFYRKEKKPA